MSEHGRGANEFNNLMEHEGVNFFIQSGNAGFLKCIIYIFKKDFSKEYFAFIHSNKRTTYVMSRCRIPEFFEGYKIDNEIFDLESKRILPRNFEHRDVCVCIHKSHFCVIWKKNRRNSLINGVEELERNFEYVKNRMNENILNHRIRYRLPKRETIDQLEKVFVFDLETKNDKYLQKHMQLDYMMYIVYEISNRDLFLDEIVTEKDNVIVFVGSNANSVTNMLRHISENYEGDERTYNDKDGDEIVSSYRLLLVAHNSSGFDSWILLNFLVKEITESKNIKTARRLT